MQIKMTTKRQATFPKKLCEEMRLEPGRSIRIEQTMLDGQPVWVLSPLHEQPKMQWVGSLRRYAGTKMRPMSTTRARIAEAMANGDLD